MPTLSQLRSVRRRTTSAGITWLLTTVICSLAFLSAPSGASAQNTSVVRSGALSKSDASTVESHRDAARIRAYRANYSSEITSDDLDLFIDRTRLRTGVFGSISGSDRSLSKNTSSVLEDMQLVPDQTFENSDDYGAPDLVTISDNVIGMVYTDRGIGGGTLDDPPVVGPRLLFRKSSDGGVTWGDPIVVADDADFVLNYYWVSIGINAGGRLVIIDETPFIDNHAFYSDDFGATWTEIAYEETNVLDRIIGPVNGKFWVEEGEFYDDFGNLIQSKVEYVTSDDGTTWSGPQTMLASIPSSSEVHVLDIARTGDASYLAVFSVFLENPCCSDNIGLSTSTDNGVTWSAITVLDVDIQGTRSPRISTDAEGKVFLTFVGRNAESEYYNEEIFVSESTDGGATFSTPEPFTRFVGGDQNPAQTMAGSDPLIAYQSDRGTQNHRRRVWYGMGGANRTPDLDPPPVVEWFNQPSGWIPAEREIPLSQIIVLDESGVAGAELHVTRGEETGTVPLFDDGAHGDKEAGDGIFSGNAMPTPFGPNLQVYPLGTDTGENVGYGWAINVTVASLHDVGNLVTAITPEGALGVEPLQDYLGFASARFPKEDGFNYLHYAGLWVGINKAPGKRVSHLFYDNIFGSDFSSSGSNGDWQVTQYPTEAPGESEMDVVMHYNDSGAPHPMGLAVRQTTYQWSDANFIIFDYEITNESGGDLNNLFAAMAADPDMAIGADAWDDQIGYDADRALIYALDSGTTCAQDFPELCTDTHLGLALISDGTETVGKAVPTAHTAARWSGFSGSGDPERTSSTKLDASMYDLMTSGIWPGFNLGLKTSLDEWRMLLTAQPFDLAAGETRRLVFGLVAGGGEIGIQASADAMTERFEKAVLAVEQVGDFPTKFGLEQNYPNPFNPSTTIPFSVTSTSPVTLTVFDVLGRQVDRIVNETLSAGSYTATFENKSLPSGAYYYTLTADGQSITKSMFLLK